MDPSVPAASLAATRTPRPRVRNALWVAAGAGLLVAAVLLVRGGIPDIVRLLDIAGWRLLWLVPIHLIPLVFFGAAWRSLLGRDSPNLMNLTWGALVRESVSGLLPVARVGGEVAGVRLLVRRGVPAATAGASVVVELTSTMVAQALFAATGLVLLSANPTVGPVVRIVTIGLVVSVIAIVGFVVVVRRWGRSVFALMQRVIAGLTGGTTQEIGGDPARFHDALHAMFANRRAVLACTIWQVIGLVAGAIEVWVTLALLGRPASVRTAIILESLATAVQSAMFIVPAGLGTQEGGFVLFGAAVGLPSHVALALSLARRMRQTLVGVPALLSWYVTESELGIGPPTSLLSRWRRSGRSPSPAGRTPPPRSTGADEHAN